MVLRISIYCSRINILLAFDENIESLRKEKLVHISLDGPNVNVKLIGLLKPLAKRIISCGDEVAKRGDC